MSGEWHDAIGCAEIEEEDVRAVEIAGIEIAIYRVKGQYFATEDACTHGSASLAEGVVIGDIIECPLHQGRFCVRTGKPKGGPVVVPLRTFPTKIENDRVLVQVSDAAAG